MGLQPGEALCIPVPLYHCFGMVLGNLAAAAYGVTMVFPGESFDAGETLAALDAERCNAVHGVPTMFAAMLDHPDFSRFDLSAMRTGIMAGAPCPVTLMRRVVRDMGCREITIAYGMTETSPISFQSSVDDGIDDRVSTVGRIQPHVEVKVVDESGRTTPVGAQGELLTRGYSVMQGYWGDREATREAIVDGWMRTGDLATIDARGYCRIVGRAKDMLIRGGENVYPAEIEDSPPHPPRRRGGRGLRRSGRALRRGGLRLRDSEARTRPHRGGVARVLPRAHRALQGPAARALRLRDAGDGDRQAAEVQDA